jgi:hypothetical protein
MGVFVLSDGAIWSLVEIGGRVVSGCLNPQTIRRSRFGGHHVMSDDSTKPAVPQSEATTTGWLPIAVPRAWLDSAEGTTTEWKSTALREKPRKASSESL